MFTCESVFLEVPLSLFKFLCLVFELVYVAKLNFKGLLLRY